MYLHAIFSGGDLAAAVPSCVSQMQFDASIGVTKVYTIACVRKVQPGTGCTLYRFTIPGGIGISQM